LWLIPHTIKLLTIILFVLTDKCHICYAG